MDRKDFEEVLKKSLEIQNLKDTNPVESFSEEDLRNAAARLGIQEEILEQAIRVVKKKKKCFTFLGSPEEVKKAFLQHFLMQETLGGPGSQSRSPVRIDHEAIRVGDDNVVRVFHNQYHEVDALVRFSVTKDGETEVSWSGNKEISLAHRTMAGAFPPVVYGLPVLFAILWKGVAFAEFFPVVMMILFFSFFLLWGQSKAVPVFESALETYFENQQILDDLERKKRGKKEIPEHQPSPTVPAAEVLSAPFPEAEEVPETEPMQPRIRDRERG
jgi:hypothetical protein